jgi:hypothetical protein
MSRSLEHVKREAEKTEKTARSEAWDGRRQRQNQVFIKGNHNSLVISERFLFIPF